MANWAKLQETLTDLPVYKRAKHGIHFDKGDGQIVANFSGKPCHYQDTDGLWKPIDTRLLLGADGFYGCPHSPVKVHQDGRVKATGSDYSQFTELPGSPIGRVDGDKIVREFPGGYQELFVTEDGFREVITVNKPTFPIEKFLAKQSGTLPSAYKTSPQTAVDANGNEFVITSDTKAFGDWLDGAVYPVVIDPDFTGDTGDGHCWGNGTTSYANSRTTPYTGGGGFPTYQISDRLGNNLDGSSYRPCRVFLKFNTSSIGAGSTVTEAKLKICDNYSTRTTDVYVKKADWSSYDPLSKSNVAAVYALVASSDLDAKGWTSIGTTLTASAALSTSWVNKTGNTYYGLQNKNEYLANETNDTPVYVCMSDNATSGKRPVLTVTYTTGSTGVPKHYLHYARLRG